ncbi:hypothetical protein AOC36_09815 [Erysipelothrix larvae]|uniref:Heptaprenyl diphosphate synthase n=1 Tax=Erysipelothrix larvae TaxID=1514105 RepID=A0A109UHJ7_9FIRM|nr:Gx transporter family protein [Erysipelothrix larvae]AMC94263.1 hypothetical protein AOC36_09815 [Erysipelothrix larvae]
MKRNKTRSLTVQTMLLAMAITVSMVESQIPLGLPGVRLGLANVLGLIAYYFFGVKEMIVLNMMRVLLVGLMRGTFLFSPGFWISFCGTLLSTMMAIAAAKSKVFSEYGICLVSSTFHNVGQVIFVAFLTNAPMLVFTYLPFLLIMGIPTGIVTGKLVKSLHERFKQMI